MQWFDPFNHTLCSYTGVLNDDTIHSLNYTIHNIKLSHVGQYTCSIFINTSMTNGAVLESGITSNSATVTVIRKC